jgi:hypothetical protein
VYYKIIGGLMAGAFINGGIHHYNGLFQAVSTTKNKYITIINFLNQDQHDQWRYLPLGFGDQMATLSYQTKALTVDGNYHSARRLLN